MADWIYAQVDPSDELAQLHYFSMKKRQAGGDVEFLITVREYVDRNQQKMRFFAQADKPASRGAAGCMPFGWGETLLAALSECMRAIRQAPADDGA